MRRRMMMGGMGGMGGYGGMGQGMVRLLLTKKLSPKRMLRSGRPRNEHTVLRRTARAR